MNFALRGRFVLVLAGSLLASTSLYAAAIFTIDPDSMTAAGYPTNCVTMAVAPSDQDKRDATSCVALWRISVGSQPFSGLAGESIARGPGLGVDLDSVGTAPTIGPALPIDVYSVGGSTFDTSVGVPVASNFAASAQVGVMFGAFCAMAFWAAFKLGVV